MIKVKSLLFSWFVLFGGAALAQVPGFYMEEDKNRVEIPFFDNNNLIIIPVSINGSSPVNFLLDTGVRSNLLFSKRLGDELDLFYSRKLDLMGADGRTVISASISPNNELKMEGLVGNAQPLLVLDEDFFVLDKIVGIPIHGVIGHEFFKMNPVRVDYDAKVVTFYKSTSFRRKPFGFRKLDLEMEGGKPYVKTVIRQGNGPTLQAKLLIDTGANHSLMLNQETSDDIKLPTKVLESELGTALGGELRGFVGRVPRLQVGRLRFKNVIASYPEETEFSDIIIETGRLGSLGSDILHRAVIIYDYSRERAFYRKSNTFRTPFEYDMSGLSVKMRMVAEKVVYIEKVREGSPAEAAGLREEDEIVAVNGIPVEFWELTEITELLRSKDGRSVKLEVKRVIRGAEVNLSKSIRLEQQI
jgi:predicted aspartyl protease